MSEARTSPVVRNLSMVRLDSKKFPFRILDSNDQPLDLTGGSAELIIKAAKTDTDVNAKVTKVINTTLNADGHIDNPTGSGGDPHFYFQFSKADTASLSLKSENVSYYYWVSVKPADGSYETTNRGMFNLEIEGSAKTYA